jgi:hypothetical protein
MATEFYATNLEENTTYKLMYAPWVLIKDRMTTGHELKEVIIDMFEEHPVAWHAGKNEEYAEKIANELNKAFGEGKKLTLEFGKDILIEGVQRIPADSEHMKRKLAGYFRD